MPCTIKIMGFPRPGVCMLTAKNNNMGFNPISKSNEMRLPATTDILLQSDCGAVHYM